MCSYHVPSIWIIACELFSHLASGLECHHCENSTSWKSCDENLKDVTCPESFERCFKANITRLNAFKNISRSVFARGCADRCDASGILHCEEHVICDAYCCTADLCNMSPSMATSRILFVFIAALLTFTHIVHFKWNKVNKSIEPMWSVFCLAKPVIFQRTQKTKERNR